MGALALGLWSLRGDDDKGLASADALPNQIWIDRVPESDRDMITHLLLLDHPRARNFGLVGNSSQWRHQIELLRWRLDGSSLGMLFPQDRRKAKLKARTWDCAGTAPEPFELCLELKVGDRKLNMYSRKDWVVEPQGENLAELVASTPALAGLAGVQVTQDLSEAQAEQLDAAAEDFALDADFLVTN